MKRLVKKHMVLTLVLATLISTNVSAGKDTLESEKVHKKLESLEQNQISSLNKELVKAELQEEEFNEMDRSFRKKVKVERSISKKSPKKAYTANDNTDPNYAYLIQNSDIVGGTIETEGEMRWYGFNLDTDSKITLNMNTVDTMDADIFLFELTPSYTLELIGGSAQAGLGVSERVREVLGMGIYYVAVAGYEGTGDYAFEFYNSSTDVQYEVNDTLSTASNISTDMNINGVIDCHSDVDYYAINVNTACVVRYAITNPSGSSYKMLYANESGGSFITDNLLKLNPGTHYFAVYSPLGTYSNTKQYTIKLTNVAPVSSDSSANIFACNENAKIVFQFDRNRTRYYVNGNRIDFFYLYERQINNSAGNQNYYIELSNNSNIDVCLVESEVSLPAVLDLPTVGLYQRSTLTNISNKPVLTLSLFSDPNTPFYKIHNVCSGAYAGNSMWADLNYAQVYIDPDTGRVIDIRYFNYFYEIGSHDITYNNPYGTMQYYYSIYQ